jgi:tetratricopeptide (TPR) repeat protein
MMRARIGAVVIIGILLAVRGLIGAEGGEVGLPAPLLSEVTPTLGRGIKIDREGAARRALEMGFPSVAAGIYSDLVAKTTPGPAQDSLIHDWAIGLMEDDRVDEAGAALQQLSFKFGPRAYLRQGLIAMSRNDVAAAESFLTRVQVATLPEFERPWFHYLVGSIADANAQPELARRAFRSAIAASTSVLQKARFELAELHSTWQVSAPTEAQADRLLRDVQTHAGERVGYDSIKRYVAVLAALGRSVEAIAFLQNQLLALPAAELRVQDDFRLLLGVMAGADSGIGRTVLTRLLIDGSSREKQRIALRLLARDSRTTASRVELRDELTRLLNRDPPHPIEQDLLLYRAQLASDEGAATRDALALLERFPASDLRPTALAILVSAAWNERRFRSAASYATQARQALVESPDEIRAQLGLLQAEAFFRGGDYRSAADAYAAALEELPVNIEAGDLVFQEVLSRIEDNQLTDTANRIDILARDSRLDVVNRWKAEWNLALALQSAGRGAEAYARVDRIVAEDSANPALPADLAVRIAWLQTRLALEVGEPTRTLERAPSVRALLGKVDPVLAVQVDSSLGLQEAEALFALGRSDEALLQLQKVRDTHAGSDAAVYSYIAEANYHAGQGQLVKAQELLTMLVTNHPQNEYAEVALYQSALMAEGRREEIYLREAIGKIQQLVTTYPRSKLLFHARFKQGDLLRRIGEWGLAQQTYESIINANPLHPDVLAAQMALADTLAAQAGSNDSLRDSAAAIYERLRDLASAPAELRIEAGLKAGNALVRRAFQDRAIETWWQVVDAFLLNDEAAPMLGTKGRYWLARILAQLGETLEAQQELDSARNAYELIRDRGLPQGDWAAAQLVRLGIIPIETNAGGS